MNPQRNFIKEPKSSRISSKYYGQGPLSGRNMNEGYYQDHTRTTHVSRQFKNGIFTSELNKKNEAGRRYEEQRQIPLQVEEVLDYPNVKTKNSKRQFEYSRHSRDEASYGYHQNQDFNVIDERQIKEEMRAEMQVMRQEMEMSIFDRMKKTTNDHSSKVREVLEKVIADVNEGFEKKDRHFHMLRNELKQEISNLDQRYQSFSRQSEEKLENIYVEMSSMGAKKSRSNNGEYNLDLKNSFQGLNSSMSVNIGNQSQHSKLVNQVIFQLDSQKKELNQTKQTIEELTQKINSRAFVDKIEKKDERDNQEVNFNREEVSKMLRQALADERRRNNFQDKMQQFQAKIRQIDRVIHNQEQNMAGMNEQFKFSVNHQITPKIKKIESSLSAISAQIDPISMQKTIRQTVQQSLTQKMKQTKILRVRQCSIHQNQKLSVLTGKNKDTISYKQTYLLDEQNYLLDSEGRYLTENIDSQKQRIKIDNDMIYLLQLKGIDIQNSA